MKEVNFSAGMKLAYPLVFGTNLTIISLFINAVLAENYLLLFV